MNPLTRYKFEVFYTPTTVLLGFMGPPTPFHEIIASGRAGEVAKCFDQLFALELSDMRDLINILEMQSPAGIAKDFLQMLPTNFNNIAFAQENVAERIRQIYTNHLFEQRVVVCPEDRMWRWWAAPFLERVKQHGTSKDHGYVEKFGGFSTALDYRLHDNWMFTGGFSYASSNMHMRKDVASADFNTYAGTVGAAWTGSKWFADAQISYLYTHIHAKRKMSFVPVDTMTNATLDLTAKHSQGTNEMLSHLGFGYDFITELSSSTTLNVYPFANIDYIYLPHDGYTEHGAGSLDLKVESQKYDLLRPEEGIGFAYKTCFKKTRDFL